MRSATRWPSRRQCSRSPDRGPAGKAATPSRFARLCVHAAGPGPCSKNVKERTAGLPGSVSDCMYVTSPGSPARRSGAPSSFRLRSALPEGRSHRPTYLAHAGTSRSEYPLHAASQPFPHEGLRWPSVVRARKRWAKDKGALEGGDREFAKVADWWVRRLGDIHIPAASEAVVWGTAIPRAPSSRRLCQPGSYQSKFA
jgi:hypothetical protein